MFSTILDFYNDFVDKSIPLSWVQAVLRRPQMYSPEIAEAMSTGGRRKLAALLLSEREKMMDEILIYYTDDGKMVTGKTMRQLIGMGYKV